MATIMRTQPQGTRTLERAPVSSTFIRPIAQVATPGGGTGTVVLDDTHKQHKSLRPWIVLVLDDNNTMDHVVHVLQKLFGYTNAHATKLMLEVHLKGRSVVAHGPKEKCEYDLVRLTAEGLTAKIEEAA